MLYVVINIQYITFFLCWVGPEIYCTVEYFPEGRTKLSGITYVSEETCVSITELPVYMHFKSYPGHMPSQFVLVHYIYRCSAHHINYYFLGL